MADVSQQEQASYEANVKGWAGDRSARVKADDHILNEINSRQQAEAMSASTAKVASTESVAAIQEVNSQKVERGMLKKIRSAINALKSPGEKNPPHTSPPLTTPLNNPA